MLRQDRHIYIMFDSFSMLSLGALVRECFDVKGVIVWDKMHLGMGHYFRRRHEQIVFASKGRRKVARRDLPDVWAVPRIHRAAYPTQKPVQLFEMMLEASAEPGFTVCDPFCGSGSSASRQCVSDAISSAPTSIPARSTSRASDRRHSSRPAGIRSNRRASAEDGTSGRRWRSPASLPMRPESARPRQNEQGRKEE